MTFAPPPVGPFTFSFRMTAGLNGTTRGYDLAGGYGSLSGAPTQSVVGGVTYNPASGGGISAIFFDGDIIAFLNPLTVYVDGVSFGSGGWSVSFGSSLRSWGSNTGPIFVNGNTYLVEIR